MRTTEQREGACSAYILMLEREIESSIRKVIKYLKEIGVSVNFSSDTEISCCDLYRYEINHK